MKDNLSNKEQMMLDIVIDFYKIHGRYPSYRELMESMNYKSKRSISILVNQLIEKDILGKDKYGGIKLLKSFNDEVSEVTIEIPLLGEISCGIPIFAKENVESFFAISTKFIERGNKYFLLRAVGDSMNLRNDIYESIDSGDLVLVKLQNWAENGNRVVALIDNEATIKEFHKQKNHIALIPRSTNDLHKTIILHEDFKIQGVVKKVFKTI